MGSEMCIRDSPRCVHLCRASALSGQVPEISGQASGLRGQVQGPRPRTWTQLSFPLPRLEHRGSGDAWQSSGRSWRKHGAEPWTVKTIQKGYRLPLLQDPRPCSQGLPLLPERSCKGEGPVGRGGADDGEGISRRSSASHAWLLQLPLPSGKSHVRLATCNRPLSSQSVCLPDKVHDGDSGFGSNSCTTGRLHGVH